MIIRAWVLLLFALGLAACGNQGDSDIAYPAAQQAFHALNSSCKNKYDEGINEIQKSESFNQCNAQRIAFSNANQISGWVGQIETISTSQGAAVTEVDITAEVGGFKLTYQTANNRLSDIGSDTMIRLDSELFKKLSSMKEGDEVAFDAEFLPDPDSSRGIWEASLTEDGSMSDPDFIVRFKDIRPYSSVASKQASSNTDNPVSATTVAPALAQAVEPTDPGSSNANPVFE